MPSFLQLSIGDGNPERKEQKKQKLREDIARLQHQLYKLENGEEVSQDPHSTAVAGG